MNKILDDLVEMNDVKFVNSDREPELNSVLRGLKDDRLRLTCLVAASTGVRQGEMLVMSY